MLYSHIFYFFGKTCTSSCISNRRMGRKGTIVCAHCNSSIFFILGAMNETAFAWISSAVQSSWGRTGPWQGRREGCWSRWERWSPNTPCLYTWNKRLGNYMNNSYYSRRVFFLKLSGLLSRKFQSQIRRQNGRIRNTGLANIFFFIYMAFRYFFMLQILHLVIYSSLREKVVCCKCKGNVLNFLNSICVWNILRPRLWIQCFLRSSVWKQNNCI